MSADDAIPSVPGGEFAMPGGYFMEKWMYGIGFFFGTIAVSITAIRIKKEKKKNLVLAARLISYKLSLSVADFIILFIYAPTQFIWITTFWWYGGDWLCRGFKFIVTFAFHLTGNMQVLIALDRLYITTRLHKVAATTRGGPRSRCNANTFILIAWGMAFLCALPQLFIFGQGFTQKGHPQCISIWTSARYKYQQEKERWSNHDFFYNVMLKNANVTTEEPVNLDKQLLSIKFNPPNTPAQTMEEVESEYYDMLFLEQAYNIFHLASICMLPYLLELICYACILYLLKGAKRGQFISFGDIARAGFKCICWPFCKDKKKAENEIDIEMMNVDEENRAPVSIPTIRVDRVPRCASFAGGLVEDERTESTVIAVEEPSTSAVPETSRRTKVSTSAVPETSRRTRVSTSDVPETSRRTRVRSGDRRKERSKKSKTEIPMVQINGEPTTSQDTDDNETPPNTGRSTGALLTVDPRVKPKPKSQKKTQTQATPKNRRFLTKKQEREAKEQRRASAPPNAVKYEIKPWMNTVAIARRRTRRKAFYMLTLNLIFWAPYVILGIVTAVTVFESYYHYQFVCGLLVFNAITNILL